MTDIKTLASEIDDFLSLAHLIDLLKANNLTLRSFELVLFLRIPRTPFDIETGIDMDRMTLKKMYRMHPKLIAKRVLMPNGDRGRPPVVFGLTAEGVKLLETLKDKT